MAISAAICTSYKMEALQGIHLAADVYKLALYSSSATLGASTTAYTATNEVPNGSGYATGGTTLTGFTVSNPSGTTAILDFSTDASWASASFTARGALLYNSSRSNKAVAVLDFGSDITATAGTFTVTFPTADAANALIRLT